jgi:hypothetical protein
LLNKSRNILGLRRSFKTLHADLNAFGRPVHHLLDGAQVGVENPVVHVVGVRDGLSRYRVLAADFACFGHISSDFFVLIFFDFGFQSFYYRVQNDNIICRFGWCQIFFLKKKYFRD